MRYLISICLLIQVFSVENTWAQEWQYVNGGGGYFTDPFQSSRDDILRGMDLDSRGNLYISGGVFDNARFGDTTINNPGTSLNYDAVLAKYNCDGSLGWVRTEGSPDDPEGYGPMVIIDDYMYVIGWSTIRIPPNKGYSQFIEKRDTSGRLIWSRFIKDTFNIAQNTGHDRIWKGEDGNMYIYGVCDSGWVTPNHFMPEDGTALFVIDTSCELLRFIPLFERLGAPSTTALDLRFDILPTSEQGFYLSTVFSEFDSGVHIIDQLYIDIPYTGNFSNPNGTYFISKFDSTGTIEWYLIDTTWKINTGLGRMELHPEGGIVIGCQIFNGTDFGDTVTIMPSSNSALAGLHRFDEHGNHLWSSYPEPLNHLAASGPVDVVAYGDSGFVFVIAGRRRVRYGNDTLPAFSNMDPIVLFYDLDGNYQSYLQIDDNNNIAPIIYPLADDVGNLYLCGSITNDMSVYNDNDTLTYYHEGGHTDLFVSKWGYETCFRCDKPNATFTASDTFFDIQLQLNVVDADSFQFYSWDTIIRNQNTLNLTAFDTGYYAYCVLAFNECGIDTACDSVYITCPNTQAMFVANQAGLNVTIDNNSLHSQLVWIDWGDGNIDTLLPQTQYTHSYAGSGNYSAVFFSFNGCSFDSDTLNLSISSNTTLTTSTGIESKIYPNPTKDYLNIELQNLIQEEDYSIQLVSVLGEVLMVKNVTSATTEFNTEGLADGMYLLRLKSSGENVGLGRIIKD